VLESSQSSLNTVAIEEYIEIDFKNALLDEIENNRPPISEDS
jgi:hypothetical protein